MQKWISILFLCLAGTVIGLGFFTFYYAKGYSYFSNDPKACMNCHIMSTHYDSWRKSSHAAVTTCNSCHEPQEFYLKYFYKAENGFSHALKFTTGNFKEPIQIRQHNFDISMKACLHCHSNIFHNETHHKDLLEGRSCVKCHQDIGHVH